MEEVFAESIRRSRVVAQLLTVFAMPALLLAATATYAALASIVAERQRELGIRLALGAKRVHGRIVTFLIRTGICGWLFSPPGPVVVGVSARTSTTSMPVVTCAKIT